MSGLLIVLIVMGATVLTLRRMGFGSGPLPEGYTIKTIDHHGIYQQLQVFRGNELIATVGHINSSGYGTASRLAYRAAWGDHRLHRTVKVKPEPFVDPHPYGSPEQEQAYKLAGRIVPRKRGKTQDA